MLDLKVTVPVTCNVVPGDDPVTTDFEFDVRMELEETPNGTDICPYGPARPPAYSNGDYSTHCSDKVTLTQDTSSSFTCPDGVYTVNIVGFTSEGKTGETCDQSLIPPRYPLNILTLKDRQISLPVGEIDHRAVTSMH